MAFLPCLFLLSCCSLAYVVDAGKWSDAETMRKDVEKIVLDRALAIEAEYPSITDAVRAL